MGVQGTLLAMALLGAVMPVADDDREIRDRLGAAVAAVAGGGPGPMADDPTFLRRAYLDLAGHTPPPATARNYLDDRDPAKRAKLVDRLLDSEAFADHWGRVLAAWLTDERPVGRDAYDGRVLHAYLRESLSRREPYDRTIRELIAGTGASDASGPANYFLRYEADPPRLAGALGKGILGVTIRCAQCHDHPFAPWKLDEFWGLAAAFARVRKMEGEGNLKAVVEARRGELKRPNPDASPAVKEGEKPEPKEVVVRPRLLDGKPITEPDRRAALADWVVDRGNPRFARNVANRAWGQLLGKSPAANLDGPGVPAVIALLAEDFASHGHDLRRLLRLIVLSESYAQSSATPGKPAWARPAPRPLSVDQLHASIAQATGHDGLPDEAAEEPAGGDAPLDDPEDEDDEGPDERGDRAVEALGERSLTLQRALVLLNGEHVREASRSAVRVARATNGRQTDASRVEWAVLSTLSRRPTDKERAILRALIAEPSGAEDVYWLLLNSSEFQAIR